MLPEAAEHHEHPLDAILRLYSTEAAFLDESWRPSEIVKVDAT